MTTPPHNIAYVAYSSKVNSVHLKIQATRSEFVSRLTTHTYLSDKLSAPGFSPVTYSPKALTRCNAGVLTVNAFVYDIERKPSPVTKSAYESLLSALDSFGWEHVIYSSHSHTADAYRLRLILFPSRPMNPNEFRAAYQIVAKELGITDMVDPSTKDVSRLYFWPTCPPGTTPLTRHEPGADVDVDEVLAETQVVPFVGSVDKNVPEGWTYERPSAPTAPYDLSPLHALMDKYKGGGSASSDESERTYRTTLIRRIRRGERIAEGNYRTAILRTSGILVRLFPEGTSVEETMAILRPSLHRTYDDGAGPIPYDEAHDIAQAIVEQDLEKWAAEQAADRLFAKGLAEMGATFEQVSASTPAPTNSAELAALQQKLPAPPFIYSVNEEKYYYPDAEGYFTARTRLKKKDGIRNYLLDVGWDMVTVKTALNTAEHVSVYGFKLAPYQPPVFLDSDGRKYVNTWRAPTLKPVEGDWSLVGRVLDSLTTNDVASETVCDTKGRAWICNWLAWAVQNPAGVPGTAILFNGAPQGSGKNTLAYVVSQIIGVHNYALIKNEHLEGRFNSRWVGRPLVFGDEISAKEHDNIADRLKAMITGTSLISEAKGVDEVDVDNHSKFIFASNHVVPLKLEQGDRRFSVFTRHAPITPAWADFTRSLFDVRNNATPAFAEAIAAFAYYLERLVVDETQVKTPYDNQSRRALIAANTPAEKLFFEYVDEHGIESVIEDAVKSSKGYWGPNLEEATEKLFGEDYLPSTTDAVPFSTLYKAYVYFAKEAGAGYVLPKNRFGSTIAAHRWPRERPVVHGKQVVAFRATRAKDIVVVKGG